MTTFSRLGSANTYDLARSNLSNRQSGLSSMQEKLTAGKKIVRASDDPTGAAQAERALNRISRIATDQRALESQRSAITMAESTLGDVNDALQSFRELVVSAGNGSHSAAERISIAGQLRGLRDQVFALSNRNDANGQPLFGGLGSTSAPFVGPQTATPNYTFNGLPGQTTSSEVGIPIALDGESAFMLQPARDGTFESVVSLAAVPANRKLTASAVSVADATLVNTTPYNVKFTAVDPGVGGVTGSATATYVIEDLSTTPSTTSSPVSLTFPYGSPVTIPITVTSPVSDPVADPITGVITPNKNVLSFSITGTPAAGDVITVKPSPSSIFSVLDAAISEIGGATSSAAASLAVSKALSNIDIGMNRVSAVRGQAGDLLNRADRISSDQTKRAIQMEDDRSRAEDMDMVKGIAEFQNQQTGFQAALQSYAQVQKLSLFNYIS